MLTTGPHKQVDVAKLINQYQTHSLVKVLTMCLALLAGWAMQTPMVALGHLATALQAQ